MADDYTKKFTRREKILWKALRIICKMLRENPMGDLDGYPPELFFAIPNEGDPEGAKYLHYFLNRAKQEVEREEIEEMLKEIEKEVKQ